ncbi:MAG: SirB2 family protein [Burkholderiales bacterium]|uniref:SirB2 family protein n=1 Tax=Inhella sp. TaxID=1921806 RepID=UPI001ACB4CE3|nr:SirB2 family protein [Burkholderiales bacterium]
MFWYHEMLMLHLVLVVASIGLFFVRGLGVLMGASWPMDDRLRTLGGGFDFLITMVGLSLWGLLQISPWIYTWLLVKFLLLLAYIFFANLTLRLGQSTELRFLGFVLALACLAGMVQVSLTRDPWGGF